LSTASLAQINIYPIKSSAGIQLSSSWVDAFGLSFDRRFVLTDDNGQFITARTDHKLCLIQASLTPTGLKLSAPNMPVLSIDYQTFSRSYQEVIVWKDTINAQHCQATYDMWFSDYLDKSCQLLYFGSESERFVKNSANQVAFADGYPLMLLSENSLVELNANANQIEDFSMARFRPNLVVSGCDAFEEDSWAGIKIGEIEFEITKPCTRCIFTTVDPLTGKKHPQIEPLTTLSSFRKIAKGDVLFGQNLVPLNQGQIKVNDPVIILKKKARPIFVNNQITAATAENIQVSKNASKSETFSLRCKNIVDETHDVKTFHFEYDCLEHEKQVIGYLPGQHLPIKLDIANKSVSAVYTLSSTPTREHDICITVKRIEGGKVSNHLHDNFHVGDTLQALLPAGNFHLAEKSTDIPKKILLLSAGSGVTPMLSMLRSMADQKIKNDIVFFHSAKSEIDLIAAEEVSTLAKQHGKCQIHYTLTRSAKPQWTDYQGHISKEMLANIANLTEREVYVCGPESFREAMKTMLLALGLPVENYHFESFGLRKKVVVPETPSTESDNKSTTDNKNINILFDSWDKSHKGNTNETILEQGEEAGLILPYSCRAGMCGNCKVKLESGEVDQLSDDGLDDQDKGSGYILACSCIPKTDIVITQV